jgi:hypothetical protein
MQSNKIFSPIRTNVEKKLNGFSTGASLEAVPVGVDVGLVGVGELPGAMDPVLQKWGPLAFACNSWYLW